MGCVTLGTGKIDTYGQKEKKTKLPDSNLFICLYNRISMPKRQQTFVLYVLLKVFTIKATDRLCVSIILARN